MPVQEECIYIPPERAMHGTCRVLLLLLTRVNWYTIIGT
jgi:hypothetical protein